MTSSPYCFRLTRREMMSDASEMLAAALEQMDGIIAGNHTVPLEALHGGCPHLEAFKVHAGSLTCTKLHSSPAAALRSVLLNRNVHLESWCSCCQLHWFLLVLPSSSVMRNKSFHLRRNDFPD